MKNDDIQLVRRLRDVGHGQLAVANMLGLTLDEVRQAASEPDEFSLVDGEPLWQRVERLTKYYREQKLLDMEGKTPDELYQERRLLRLRAARIAKRNHV